MIHYRRLRSLPIVNAITHVRTAVLARHECTVEAAPIDVRRKIVHVTGDSMQPPTADAKRYSRIKKGMNPGCPRLARGLFLSVMRVFHENAFRPAYPDALRAGSDLAAQSSVNESDSNTLADTLSSRARAAFAESYRVVAKSDTGTESSGNGARPRACQHDGIVGFLTVQRASDLVLYPVKHGGEAGPSWNNGVLRVFRSNRVDAFGKVEDGGCQGNVLDTQRDLPG